MFDTKITVGDSGLQKSEMIIIINWTLKFKGFGQFGSLNDEFDNRLAVNSLILCRTSSCDDTNRSPLGGLEVCAGAFCSCSCGASGSERASPGHAGHRRLAAMLLSAWLRLC